MNLTCPHCSQTLDLAPEVLAALQGQPLFACPMCEGHMAVPQMPEKTQRRGEASRENLPTNKKFFGIWIIVCVVALAALAAGIIFFRGNGDPSVVSSSGPATIECDLPLTPFEVGKQALRGKPSKWTSIPQEFQNRLFVKRIADDPAQFPFRVTKPGIATLIVGESPTAREFEKEGWKIVATAKRTWGKAIVMQKDLETGSYSFNPTGYFGVSLLIEKDANQ